jgi:hypothetical protein
MVSDATKSENYEASFVHSVYASTPAEDNRSNPLTPRTMTMQNYKKNSIRRDHRTTVMDLHNQCLLIIHGASVERRQRVCIL